MSGDTISLTFLDENVDCVRVHRWSPERTEITFIDTTGTMVTLKLGPIATRELRREWNLVSTDTLKGE